MKLAIPRSMKIWVYRFVHLFSGLRRAFDVEHYLLRIGGSRGIFVIIESFDAAYGEEFDLDNRGIVEDLIERARRGEVDGALSGAPCSTWSRARFRPGGPPPLRDRSHPWGRPGLSQREREHCDLHSRLMCNGLDILEAVTVGGGDALNEHPADPGREPFPSIHDTSRFKSMKARTGMKEHTFPQCMVGAPSMKPTTLTGTLGRIPELFPSVCTHKSHAVILSGLDEDGNFRTRQGQTYPPAMCEKIALAFLDEFRLRQGPSGTYDAEADPEGLLCRPCLEGGSQWDVGDRVPVPEVSSVWDPLSRWTESSRWKWRETEHNNILEARAGLSSAALVVQQPSAWGSRVLLISDSQVTIGAFAKGRSSVKVLNMLCRRVAAIAFACRVKFHWRYIRTHRNHADGPSRGYPLGVAPKEETPVVPVAAAADWRKLPELFHRKTRG